MTTSRIVVVSHEATLTGAPRVAVEVVRALGGSDRSVSCVLRAGGPLVGAFEDAADRVRREPLARARALARRVAPLRGVVNRLDEVVAGWVLRRTCPDLVFCNTVKTACYVRPAQRRGIPVILHSHELGTLASSTLRRYPIRWPGVRLMACSEAARNTLAELTGVEDIEVVTSPVDVSRIEAGAAPGSSCVGACGSVNERKGADLWVEVAHAVRAQRDVGFRWVGQKKTSWPNDDTVEWLGQVDDPVPAMRAFDVFTLPSREDAFPLVVLEAMALARPVVAFDVGGVRDQLGDTGILVPPGDTAAMADAVLRLLGDPAEAARLGAAARARVEELWDVEPFRDKVSAVALDVLGAAPRTGRRTKTFLLKSWHAGSDRVQRYRIEKIEDAGVDLRYSDAVDRKPWTLGPVKAVVRRFERMGAPFLQTLLAAPRIVRSDAVVAVFESQGNALAVFRAARIWPFTRPRFVVVSCWLAMDAPRFGARKLRLYRWAYRRGVDRIVYFSPNQTEIYRDTLGIDENKLAYVPFGIDDEYFTPQDIEDSEETRSYILAVGRDRGRDWPTLFDAVRGTDLELQVVCRPEDVEGLDVPANVSVLGTVDRGTYRDLTARARVVVVATRPLAYPTGQSVTLESMAMGKCCVVSDTPAMHGYLQDEVDALLVPPQDVAALRDALQRAVADADLRKRLGVAARLAVEARYNAAAMWRDVAGHLRNDRDAPV